MSYLSGHIGAKIDYDQRMNSSDIFDSIFDELCCKYQCDLIFDDFFGIDFHHSDSVFSESKINKIEPEGMDITGIREDKTERRNEKICKCIRGSVKHFDSTICLNEMHMFKNKKDPAPIDESFIKICGDERICINANDIGLIPRLFWAQNTNHTFGWCHSNFFLKKNNKNMRFLFKLYNALMISDKYPELAPYIGITWLNNIIIKVDKNVFGRLIGIKSVDNGLFHQQGNFPSHGFVEIGAFEAPQFCSKSDLKGVNFDRIRLFTHESGVFVRNCNEEQINNIQIVKKAH